jgi:Ni/Co efflux regulator RcnB
MKKLLTIAIACLCASAIMVQAQDAAPKKAKKELTAEQKAVQDEMLAKYDTNKDGKLDKTERAAMSKEDKDKMAKAGLGGGKKKPTGDAGASTNAPAKN